MKKKLKTVLFKKKFLLLLFIINKKLLISLMFFATLFLGGCRPFSQKRTSKRKNTPEREGQKNSSFDKNLLTFQPSWNLSHGVEKKSLLDGSSKISSPLPKIKKQALGLKIPKKLLEEPIETSQVSFGESHKEKKENIQKNSQESLEKLSLLSSYPYFSPRDDDLELSSKTESPSCVGLNSPVTLCLSGKVPLQDIFLELAHQSSMDIFLDPDVDGQQGFFYKIQQEPLGKVLDIICHAFSLRYTMKDNVLIVTKDTPYVETYNIQFLLGHRGAQTKTTVKTDMFGVPGGQKSLGEGQSNIAMDAAHRVDFWTELEKTIAMILGISSPCSTPHENNDFRSFHHGKRKKYKKNTPKDIAFVQGDCKDPQMSPNNSPENSSMVHHEDFSTKSLGKSNKIKEKENHGLRTSCYSINAYGGILTVYGTQREQKIVAQYLEQLRSLVTTQLLVEAKIVEIDLFDDYKNGVQWQLFLGGASESSDNQRNERYSSFPQNGGNFLRENFSGIGAQGAFGGNGGGQYSFTLDTKYLHVLASFMERFGTVRTLANPRQSVINNQAAVLKVAHNEVFFELMVENHDGAFQRNSYINRQNISSRAQTIPIGLILYVHPSVNPDTGDILVSLHPTISRVVGFKSDPVTAMYGKKQRVESQIPIVQVREMDSVISTQDGKVVVLGGLMEERVNTHQTKLPLLSSVPILGSLCQQKTKERHLIELVILLKVSIVKKIPMKI